MSLFTDILASIGGDPAQPAQPPVKCPASTTGRPSDDLSRPTARLGISGIPNGLKRKAEDILGSTPKEVKPAYSGTMSKSTTSAQTLPHPRSSEGNKPSSKPPSRPTTPSVPTIPKAPAKGSYAEIIARAKAAQEERGTNQVGMIKHQKEQRERVSYLSQRKFGNEDARAKAEKLDRLKKGGLLNGRIDKRARSRSGSPVKRPISSKGEKEKEKPIRPRAPRPNYSGTMRTAPSKDSEKAKSASKPGARRDEYLGTDEEDNSELDEQEDYLSDESEDMEAGAFDIDEEEEAAARAARMEDAKEAALEKKLKIEKEERRKRLEELAKKAPGRKF